MLFSLRVQICLLSLVGFPCFVCRNDAVWFLNLVLKSFSVRPMYVSVVLLSLHVTVAWQISDDWRQFPLSGHVFFCWQLQVLVSFVLVLSAVSSMCLDEFKLRLLWLAMVCLVLFLQLWQILIVLQLKIFRSLRSFGKCLSIRVRNLCPILVLKVFLNGGLYQSMLFCCLSFHLLAVGAP